MSKGPPPLTGLGNVAGSDAGGDPRRDGRMTSEIAKAVQAVIARGLNDPRISGMITVIRVELLDQRRLARVWLSVMPSEKADLTLHGLRAATGHIRRESMSRVRSRMFPQLEFLLDEDYARQAEVLSLIAKVETERNDRIDPDSDTGASGSDPENAPETNLDSGTRRRADDDSSPDPMSDDRGATW